MERCVVVLRSMGIRALANVQVIHCAQSYGLMLECQNAPVVACANPVVSMTETAAMNSRAGARAGALATASVLPDAGSLTGSVADGGAVTMQATPFFKLVYSGDTRPCSRLVQLGQGSTVLIHEATFENSKQEEAVHKNHSTIDEALQVGAAMGATVRF